MSLNPEGSEHPPRTFTQNGKVLIPIALLQSLVYGALNQFPLFPPRPLPVTAVDRFFPFLPWTVLPYMVFFLGSLPVAFLIRTDAVLRTAVRAYFLCLAITVPIFLLWPTACPRSILADDVPATWDIAAYRLLTVVDSPACSFPSFHIILPTIVCWAMWQERRWWAGWFAAAMFVLSFTILTTKQHYAWDWLGGFAIAVFGIWWSHRREKTIARLS